MTAIFKTDTTTRFLYYFIYSVIIKIIKVYEIMTTICWHNNFFQGMDPRIKGGAYWVKERVACQKYNHT